MSELLKVLSFFAIGAVLWIGASIFESKQTNKPLFDCIVYPACGLGRH